MKSRRHSGYSNTEDRKLPVCFSLSARELEKVDRAASKRGYKTRSEFIVSVLKRYF